MAQEIYHRSEWGNPNEQWGNVYLNADLTNELYKRASEYENSWVTDQLLNGVGTKPSIILTPTAYEDGILNSVKPKGGENLLTYSEDFSQWATNATITPNSSISPDGTLNASLFSHSGGSFPQVALSGITFVSGADYIPSLYVKSDGTSQVQHSLLVNNIVVNFTPTDEWVRISDLIVSPDTSGSFVIAQNSGSSVPASFYIWGAQLERGSRATTYIKTDGTAYKNGDFDFTRGSSGTRINELGLVEDVQILSGELVQNGDFEEIGSEEVTNGDFEQIGSELVVNGDFSDSSWWGLDPVWSISNGSANCNGSGVIYKGGVLTIGKIYKVEVEISSYTSGTLIYPNASYTLPSAVGSYTFYYKANSQTVSFTGANFIGSIDNVSVKEVGQDWTFSSQPQLTPEGARVYSSDGSFQYIQQSNILTIGKTYVLTFDLINSNNGYLKIGTTGGGSDIGNFVSAVQNHTFYFTAVGDDLSFSRGGVTDITIDNVSVKEVGQNWSFGTSWSMGDGVAISDGGSSYLTDNVSSGFISGKKYRVSLEIVEYNSGSVSLPFDGTGANTNYQNSIGVKTADITAENNSPIYVLSGGFDGTIDNVSVIEITDDTDLPRINYTNFDYEDVLGDELVTNGSFDTDSDWSKGSNTVIGNGKASFNGVSSYVYQNILTIGKIYTCSVSVKDWVSGVALSVGSSATGSGTVYSDITRQSNTTTTFTFTAVSTTLGIGSRSFNIEGSIDNVSVKELTEDVLVPYSGEGSLLLEPQSTNLVTYSEAFSNWNKSSGVIVTDNTTDLLSPSGQYNASKIEYGDSNRNLFQAPIMSGNYSGFFYVKGTEGETIRMSVGGNEQNFTLSGDWDIIKIENVTALANTINVNTYGGATARTIYLWGAQLEQGSYATSYVPTEGSIKTRLQDVCNNSGNSDLINSTEGVLYAEVSAFDNIIPLNRKIVLGDGSYNNGVEFSFQTTNNKMQFIVRSGGSIGLNIETSSFNVTEFNKIAILYKLNEGKVFVNGSQVGLTDTSVVPPIGLNRLGLKFSTAFNFEGNVKSVAVFKEALSDTELQKLTTI